MGELISGPTPPHKIGEHGDRSVFSNQGYMNHTAFCVSRNFLLLYAFASTDIRVEREVWAVTTISFISELGGALSLFVGVSFLSVWDLQDYFCARYQDKFKRIY